MFVAVYCNRSCLFVCGCVCLWVCPPALHNVFHTPTARNSLFVLKVPLNTNQLTPDLCTAGNLMIDVATFYSPNGLPVVQPAVSEL